MTTEEITDSHSAAIVVDDRDIPFQFEGNHFKRWQQKMMFYLTIKGVAKVLKDTIPVVLETDEQAEKDKKAKEILIWNEHDYLCKNFILNRLIDDLYDYYSRYNTAKQVWDALKERYDVSCGLSDWWIDTGASCHICYDYAMFKTYNTTKNKKARLADSSTTKIVGTGDVELQFTDGKKLVLRNVMHAPKITKKFISGFLLNKAGFTQTIEADLYTITKNGIFIGKGNATNGLFKLNIDI